MTDIDRVPAIGPQRRLRALVALGWPLDTLAGMLEPGDTLMVKPRSHHDRLPREVDRSAAERVAALYGRLSMTPGPDPELGRRARAHWTPPLGWDEGDIDLPEARPARPPRERKPPYERVAENIEWLLEGGMSPPLIVKQTGVSARALSRSLYRAKRYDLAAAMSREVRIAKSA